MYVLARDVDDKNGNPPIRELGAIIREQYILPSILQGKAITVDLRGLWCNCSGSLLHELVGATIEQAGHDAADLLFLWHGDKFLEDEESEWRKMYLDPVHLWEPPPITWQQQLAAKASRALDRLRALW